MLKGNAVTELTRKQLDEGVLTDKSNHIIVEVPYSTEGATTKGGIVVGFNRHLNYAEGTNLHSADMQECWGVVYKCPQKLYFNTGDPNSMNWETDMELQEGDMVWFSIMESANAHHIECEGKLYKIIPYADCYVAKRHHPTVPLHKAMAYFGGADPWNDVIPLNGYVLCQTVNLKKISDLDVVSEDTIDKSRVIVRHIGSINKQYKTSGYKDHTDLMPGDEVLLEPRTPFLYLERKGYMARFDGDNLYIVVSRRKILAVLNRK